MKRLLGAAVLLPMLGCSVAASRVPTLPPLAEREGEVYLYLDPLEPSAGELEVSLSSVALAGPSGNPIPLELALRELGPRTVARQRLLAFGRVPAGEYGALLVTTQRATTASGGHRADLAMPTEPARVPLAASISGGKATLLALSLDPARSIESGSVFTPIFRSSEPPRAAIDFSGYCTSTALASVTVFDGRQRRASGVIPVGREPEGMALDAARNQLYVALAGEDQVEILDLVTGLELTRVRLAAGDRPRELALTSDGRTLVVLNTGSATVSFVDPVSAAELARVRVGEDPTALLLDRQGRRAYVLSRRLNTVTALDPLNRTIVATAASEAEPVRAQLNRNGSRLYVAHGASAFMTVFALPALTVTNRVYVGFGATALKVDPRTDLLYLARQGDAALAVFDPLSLIEMERIDLPGVPSYLTIDDLQNTLVALVPDARAVAFVDLASRKLVGAVDVGAQPYMVSVARERN